MPLHADPTIYDIQAHAALDGGVLYRDVVEPNLPGVVWVHMLVRSLFGWSTYALRAFDLVVISGIVLLLVRITKISSSCSNFQLRASVLTLLLFWLYFSTGEAVHCERDLWLMLPALGALWFRMRQSERLLASDQNWNKIFLWSSLEGFLWGAAFWIKPFVAVPALGALITSGLITRRWRANVIDFAGVFLGGAMCGAMGSYWLIHTGAWHDFWDILLNWNPSYFEAGRERWTFSLYLRLNEGLLPWSLIHLVALPVSIVQVSKLLRGQLDQPSQKKLCILAAAYLGWVLQAHTMQRLFEYVHVPGMLLGLCIVTSVWPQRGPNLRVSQVGLMAFLFLALIASPATNPQRLAWWGECVTQGSTPEVKSALQLMPLPNWTELQPVIDYLDERQLEDEELTVSNLFIIHVYSELGLKPSTRFIIPDVHMKIFPDKAHLIEQTILDSRQKYVVSSLMESGVNPEDVGPYSPHQPPQLPNKFPEELLNQFPFNQKLVLRSGQYVVHQVIPSPEN
ncbi:hypothetical protein [Thalassoglobus polymorphus]|nr:hypothetical protein [Thalassoglobus polymorphus]